MIFRSSAVFVIAGLLAALMATMLPTQSAEANTTVVEFYNAAQDHYFVTSSAQEIADLDAGVHGGWRRTGLSFNAYDTDRAAANAVCRFYLPPSFGDSHFYSASAQECADTVDRFPGFVLESANVFRIGLPDAISGACLYGTMPVYRLWNARADTNHRYTTDRALWQHMRDVGWVAEGYGADQVIMCAPPGGFGTVDFAAAGRAIVKARAGQTVVAVLEERLTSIFEVGPDRILTLLDAQGQGIASYNPPPGWALADFAVHPSGEVSLVLTTQTKVRLVRLDRNGCVRSDESFTDAAAAMDPFFDFTMSLKDDTALQPVLMHDAARMVPLGEGIALVLRTGRNAIVAYGFIPDAAGSPRLKWRTLVEPGSSIDGVFLSSGSFDTFGQLQNHVAVHLDVDGNGTLAVAAVKSPFRSFVFEAHTAYFGEAIDANVGVLVTRIAGADGRRLGSTVIDTRELAELHGMRATGDGFSFVGRVRTEVRPDGGGWDAFVARVAANGSLASYKVVDVDRGDILFDIAALPGGRYFALGTSGYVQNPSGASISEETQPLLLLLGGDGSIARQIPVADGPRQDQLRTIESLAGRWLVGGMRNGPGTHSGDGDARLIAADGFLIEMTGLPTP